MKSTKNDGTIYILEGVEVFSTEHTLLLPSDVRKIIFPSSLKKIERNALQSFTCLEEVVFSNINEVVDIENMAFGYCWKLRKIKLPCVQDIKGHMFYECKALQSIRIPSSVENIETCAFSECSSLKRIYLSNGLKRLQTLAFSECSSLERIAIPKTVEYIARDVFRSCKNLKEILVAKTVYEKMREYIDTILTDGNNAQVHVVDDDFEMTYEDEEEAEESSEASNEVAETQTVSKIQMPKSYEMAETQTVPEIQMPKSYCGTIKPNILTKRKNKNSIANKYYYGTYNKK